MFRQLGVRARLLFAFFGISAFALLAATAAWYSFLASGRALEQITHQRLPSVLASQELALQAERMVAAAPALLTVTTPEAYEQLSEKIAADIDHLNALLAELKQSEVEPAMLAEIERLVKWLGLNLISLDSVAFNNLTIVEQKQALLEELSDTHTSMQKLLASHIRTMETDVERLRGKITIPKTAQVHSRDPKVNPLDDQARKAAMGTLSESIAAMLPLQKAQFEAWLINDTLLQAASATRQDRLPPLAEQLERSLDSLQALAGRVEPSARAPLLQYVARFRAFTKGRNSILGVRARELENAITERQFGEQADVSRQLTEAVQKLVESARQDITRANSQALSVQRYGTAILIAVVALSLISSTLIVWLYVGRNLIARLTALSNSMLAIAGGNLKADLPPAGPDEIGRMAQALTVFRDTAVEIEEANLREVAAARQRLLDAIESISEGFSLYDAQDRLVLCNSRYRSTLHAGSEEDVAPGMTFEDIIRRAAQRGLIPETQGHVDTWVSERLERHRSPSGPYVQQRRDGTWLRINERKTEDGSTVAVYTDITELKRREAALAEANLDMDAVLGTIKYGVLFADSQLRVRLANRAYRDMWGVSQDFLESRPTFHELMDYLHRSGAYAVPADHWEDYRKARIKALKKGNVAPVEVPLADGKILQYQVIALPDGGRMLTYFDITELKRREAELAELVEKLEIARDQAMQATRAKSEFLANMSHELRTPLNAVIGIAELLLEDARDLGQQEQIEPLERIHRAGAHLLQLINDLLDLSKIEAGKMELHITDFDLTGVVNEAVLTVQPLAHKNKNRLIVDCPSDIGSLRADDVRVRQVILNLLSNACKFTENGEIRLTVAPTRFDEADGVSISVADTGIGLSAEQITSLFQDFVQADTSTTRKYGGSGLGLAISQRFCRMMGGEITVHSEPGHGSTFTIWLPRMVAPANEQASEPAAEAIDRNKSKSAGLDLSRGTVLVIDDDRTVCDLLEKFLARQGFRAVTATNGVDGLARAKTERPAAIILDAIMPEMDGWAVLAACKSDPQLAEIPVIMLTIVDDRTRGYALGAAEYLVKPLDRKRLRAVLNKHCARRGRILVIEDDAPTRASTRQTAEKQGFTVIEAANGREALERVSETIPDLILLDLMMPEMDGFDFLLELHKRPEWREIPVVVMTAKDLTEDDRQRLNGRVTHIAQKGVMSQEQILAEVQAVMASQPTTPAAVVRGGGAE
jgi:signal transduction histidine kinase/DNA-binding response OmpR family regulator/methyl-accepting chemotaxis protein